MMQDESQDNAILIELLKEKIAILEQNELAKKQLEASLREQERTYFTLLNNLPGMVYRCRNDRQWTMEFISSGCQQLTGYDENELINNKLLSFNEIISEEYRAELWQKWQDVLIKKENFQAQYTIICKDGSIKWVLEQGCGVYGIDGEVVAIEGFISDISFQVNTRRELEKSKKQYQLLAENTHDVIFTIGLDLKYTYLSPSAYNLLGYSVDELLNQHINTHLTPESVKTTLSLFNETMQKEMKGELAENYFNTIELEQIKKDNTKIFTEISITFLRDEHGKAFGILGVTRDITDRNNNEKRIAESEAKYRLIFEHSPLGILHYNSTGVITACNDKFVQIIGSSHEALIGLNLLHLKDPKLVAAVNVSLKGNPCFYEGDYQSVTANKTTPVRVFFSPAKEIEDHFNGGVGIVEDYSKQKIIETAFLESEDRFFSLYTNMAEGVALHELLFDDKGIPVDYKIIDVNRQFERITNLKKEEVLYKKATEIYKTENAPYLLEYSSATIDNISFSFEIYYEPIDKYFSISVSPMGKNGFATIFTDITQRKKAEEELLLKTEELDQFFSIAIDLLCIADTTGHFKRLNKQWTETFGYSLYQLENQLIFNFIHPDDLENTLRFIEELQQQKSVANFINRFKCANGSYKWIEWRSAPVGNTVYAAARDITDRKKNYEALCESENKFRVIVEQLSDGLVVINELGNIIEWNKKHEEITKLSKEKVLNKPVWEIFSQILSLKNKERIKIYENLVHEALITGESPIFEQLFDIKIPQENEGFKYYQQLVFPIKTETGFWMGSVTRDISEIKKVEQELQLFNKELKERNHEYASLNEEYVSQNEELLKAKEKAEESDRLKSAFLANMSHEIRTPMNGIMGFSDLLINSEISSDEKVKYAEVINNSCRQLLSIINDIIDISKIEAEQVVVSNTVCNLHCLMNDINMLFQSFALNNQVDLRLKQGWELAESNILIDQIKLRQVISNLLSNAIKFSKNSLVEFGYGLEDNALKFYVKDNGIGIAPEYHEIIFNRFRQVELTDARSYGGTGLGLAISKSLVEMMDGEIWVESEVGKGSIFYIKIPYISTDLKGENTNTQINDFQYKNWKNRTVLIVEDEATNFLYLKKVLSKTDVNVIHAVNGQEAIDFCKTNQNIDIVLMDIKMSVKNGYEATKEIKANNPRLPIIAQTAYAMAEDETSAINAGCDEYISKPIDIGKLLELISKYLDTKE